MRELLAAWIIAFPGVAWAVPGPDSTVVVASSSVAESLQLAQYYAEARGLPDRHICVVPVDDRSTIDWADYQVGFEAPLRRCLQDAGIEDRIEAFVIARGLPIRVAIPTDDGVRRAALAAVLGVWTSELTSGPRVAGLAPGFEADCGGTPCYAARLRNPYTNGVFSPGWQRRSGGIDWTPKLVTMLHGRSFAEARLLVASATAAEALGPAGAFVLMEGANAPRAVLDDQFDLVQTQLEGLGQQVLTVPFDGDRSFDGPIAGFVTGSQSLGDTIEANDYAPGALVDNLTSLGAVPPNFTTEDERQVSIARWIARGAAGVHGCTDEPLNNVFPSRGFLTDYAAGYTLAEAFHRRMPFVYWRNLVLGDPMAAPYAERPQVRLSVEAGDLVAAGREVSVEVTDARPLTSVRLFLDGVEIGSVTEEGRLDVCLRSVPDGEGQLLAVAQVAAEGDEAQPKGWTSVPFIGAGGTDDCASTVEDMGVGPDAGPDLGSDLGPPPDGGPGSADGGSTDLGPPGTSADAGAPIRDEPRSGDGSTGCASTPASTPLLLLGLIGAAIRRRNRRFC